MAMVSEERALYSVQSICAGLGIGRASFYTDVNDQVSRLSPNGVILGRYR